VTLQVAVIIPEQPNSRPFNNFDSEPGKAEKLSNFRQKNYLILDFQKDYKSYL